MSATLSDRCSLVKCFRFGTDSGPRKEMESTLKTVHSTRHIPTPLLVFIFSVACSLCSGCALFVGSNILKAPTITISASPTTVAVAQTAILTVTAVDAVQVTVTGSDGTTYNLARTGGIQAVK